LRWLHALEDAAGRLLARLGSAGGTIDVSSVQFAPVRLLAPFLLAAFPAKLNCDAIRGVQASEFALQEGIRLRDLPVDDEIGAVVMIVAIFAFLRTVLTAASLCALSAEGTRRARPTSASLVRKTHELQVACKGDT
jgi:hypothetical protein